MSNEVRVYQLRMQSIVNGVYTIRPAITKDTDKWDIQYQFVRLNGAFAADYHQLVRFINKTAAKRITVMQQMNRDINFKGDLSTINKPIHKMSSLYKPVDGDDDDAKDFEGLEDLTNVKDDAKMTEHLSLLEPPEETLE